MTNQSFVDIAVAILTMFAVVSHIYLYRIKRVGVILIAPVSLMWVHVVGNYMQEQHWGPLWMQNHLHNLGVASNTLACAAMLTYWTTRKKFPKRNDGFAYTIARVFTKGVLISWIIGTILCVTYEVLNVTIWRADAIKQGYSGRMDWPDMSAYAIGLSLMIVNHLVVRPIALARVRKELDQ